VSSAASIRTLRHDDPRRRRRLLNRHRHTFVAVRMVRRIVPYNLLIEPLGYDQRYLARGAGQRDPQRLGPQQPESEVQRDPSRSVLVEMDLARMNRQPQADTGLSSMHLVVFPKRRDENARKVGDEQALRHVRRDEEEHSVAAIFVIAVRPHNLRQIKRVAQRTVETRTHRDLVQIGALQIPEGLDVQAYDRTVHRRADSTALPDPCADHRPAYLAGIMPEE